MEFKTLFTVMKKHLSDGNNTSYFFREVMEMITDLPEKEWADKSEITENLSDDTIKNYVKRGLSKKLAGKMLYRLTPDNLIESINLRSDSTRQSLSEDLSSYIPSDASTVATVISELLTDIIKIKAGAVPLTELESQKKQQLSANLKSKYGEYLLHECSGYCPSLGCGKSLSVTNNGALQYVYDVSLIDKNGNTSIENVIALCPQCYATYQIDTNPQTMKTLKGAKKYLSSRIQSADVIDNVQLEKGLTDIIKKITKLKEKDLVSSTLEPQKIKNKIDPSKNFILYNDIKTKVMSYYVLIDEIMISLDKGKIIDYEELQIQMRNIYKRLSKTKKTDAEIINEISAKIHKATLQDDIYCQLIVAYFIQRCEVFDAITK